MNNLTKIIGALALGLGIAVAVPVLGHSFGGGMHGPQGNGFGPGHHGSMGVGHMMNPGYMNFDGSVELRLGDLKTALKLTAEQLPAWNQYEQAIKSMVELHPRWGETTADTESHFAQMDQHLEQMKAVFEARKALYETLTSEQKDTVSKQMPGPFGHHYGYRGETDLDG